MSQLVSGREDLNWGLVAPPGGALTVPRVTQPGGGLGMRS